MTASIERRIEALEAREAQPWRWVFRRDDESEDEAKQREAVKPGERIIVFTTLDREL